jgi:hypothetical protein
MLLTPPPPYRGPRVDNRRGPAAEPPPPPGPPRVIATSFLDDRVVFTFDRPVFANFETPDDALTVNGQTPTSAGNQDASSVFVYLPGFVFGGEPWAIARQPNWLDTAVDVPEAGSL